MQRIVSLGMAVSLSVVPIGRGVWAKDSDTGVTAAQVSTAIERGVSYLTREQAVRGTWNERHDFEGGVTALCTLALLNSGVDPNNPKIRKALGVLRKIKPQKTYVVALQMMVFCAANPIEDRVLIRRNVDWLEKTQIQSGNKKGAWGYGKGPVGGDNSNTQFAILGLHEAQRAGVDVKREETWRLAAGYWQRAQNKDGSWGYGPGGPGSGSMTCAGIASVVMTADKLHSGDARVVDGQVQCCGEQQDNESLEKGLAWLGRNFSVNRNPSSTGSGRMWLYYYMYGVERVGRMTARRFIGAHDWYREGAEKLVRTQDNISGFWTGDTPFEKEPHIATSLALLFLSKGRRPVVVSKVKHGPGDDWNHHRSDLANLTAYAEKKWERDLTWQVIDPQAAQVEDLLEAPVLFINGRQAAEFTDKQLQAFRAYIDRGGFIFAEACCQGDPFDQAFRAMMDKIFPEPEYRLNLLPPEHPIWHAEERVDPDYLRPLWGIEYGCRTSVVYCPEDLSCYWELSQGGRNTLYPKAIQRNIDAARAIGVNVLTYATNREPKYKDAIQRVVESDQSKDEKQRGTLHVAKLQHPGGCNAAPGALVNLLRIAREELKARIGTDDRQISITDPQLFDYHLVFMHGRHSFRLTPAERQQLRTYLERGGTLMADAVCASPAFRDSFRREMKILFPDHPLERLADNHPLLTTAFGGYDIRKVTRRDPDSRVKDAPLRSTDRQVSPVLEGLSLGDRYAVVFSPYDLSCALEKHESLECQGYTREDAARIGLNVLLYSLHQ